MKHGYGSFNHADGSSYIGQWHNDLEHGYGDYDYPNLEYLLTNGDVEVFNSFFLTKLALSFRLQF